MTLEDRLEQIARPDQLEAWQARYDEHPVVPVNNLSSQLGDLIQDLSSLQRLHERVPEDIARGMPPNVKQDVVRQYWDAVNEDITTELEQLVGQWDALAAIGVGASEPLFKSVHVSVQRFTLFMLLCFFEDTRTTVALWNGNPEASGRAQQKSLWYYQQAQAEIPSMDRAYLCLYDQAQRQYKDLGYIQEMWDFLGIPEHGARWTAL
jgi:hypothetical protein